MPGKNGKGVDPTDVWLVSMYRQGDDGAFSELLTKYERMIKTIAYRITRDHYSAEDVAQETALRIYRRLETEHEPASSLKSWIGSVAHNAAVDAVKRTRQRPFSSLRADELESLIIYTADVPDPAEQVGDAEFFQKVWEAIGDLSDEQKLIVKERFFEGLPHKEIGLHLDVPPATVDVRAHRIRSKLKDALKPAG